MKTRKAKNNPDGNGLGFAAGMGVGAGAMGAIWLMVNALSKTTPMPAQTAPTQLPAPVTGGIGQTTPPPSGRTPEAERQAALDRLQRGGSMPGYFT
jgi:hypothetical protein